MTAKQEIATAKKQKDISLIISAYDRYYQEQLEKPSYQRIRELEAMPERLCKIALYSILKRKLLGIPRDAANDIIKYFFKKPRCRYSGWGNNRPKFYAKDLLKEFN